MSDAKHPRRRILVDKKLQLGMSLHIIGFVYFYLVIFALLANFNALKTVIMGTEDQARFVDAVTRLQIFVETFVVPLAFTFVCMCLHGVLFTHRLAGPIYRFKETLKRIRGGDLDQNIKIREHDYFQDLCTEVNEMMDGLRGNFLRFREMSRELAEQGESLANAGDLPDDARLKLLDIANASSKLRQFVDGYHLGDPGPEPVRAAEGKPVPVAESV